MFVSSGTRPCDYEHGYYPWKLPFIKHKVPCNITIKEMINRLGCPPELGTGGITEIIERGNDYWAAGNTFTQDGHESNKTLAEVGWSSRRGDGHPVWLVVYK